MAGRDKDHLPILLTEALLQHHILTSYHILSDLGLVAPRHRTQINGLVSGTKITNMKVSKID
jgi:hypothetical protein